MNLLRVLLFSLLFGAGGLIVFVLSVVLLPLLALILVGMIVFLIFKIIFYEDKGPPV